MQKRDEITKDVIASVRRGDGDHLLTIIANLQDECERLRAHVKAAKETAEEYKDQDPSVQVEGLWMVHHILCEALEGDK